jgi:hypothetical protein
MATCALGFCARTGTAAVAAVDRSGVLLGSWDIALMPSHTERFVYHHAELMPRANAAPWVAEATRACSKQTLQSVRTLMQHLDADVTAGAVVGKSLELPGPLDKILASHTLLHTAEGVFYRSAVADALRTLKVHWSLVHPDELKDVHAALDEWGKAPPPWRKEHKDAALAALTLVGRTPAAGSER